MKNRSLFFAMALTLSVPVNGPLMATEKVHITVTAAEGVLLYRFNLNSYLTINQILV